MRIKTLISPINSSANADARSDAPYVANATASLPLRYRFANAPTAKNRLLQQVYSKATANDAFVVTNQIEGLADL